LIFTEPSSPGCPRGYAHQKAGLLDAFDGTPVALVDSANKPLSTPTLEKSELIKLTYNDV
jgi:hypothetical protein